MSQQLLRLVFFSLLMTQGLFNLFSQAFITTWKTDNPGSSDDNQITIPTNNFTTYNYSVDWGDGLSDTNVGGDITHTYASPGTYTISINGNLPRIYFNNAGDKDKLLSVEQWGSISWTSMERAFFGCSNLVINAIDMPDLSSVTNMASMFRNAGSLIDGLSEWDVSNILDMAFAFLDASSFNDDLSNWDVSGVVAFGGLFFNASSFNGDLSSWDVSNARNTVNMFNNAISFNSDLSNWNVSLVTNMSGMFNNADAFNSNLSNWNVGLVANFGSMFLFADLFDGDLSGWDLSSATTLGNMLNSSGMSRENYDRTLLGWASNPNVPLNLTFGAAGVNYCQGEGARNTLINDKGWSIADSGKDCITGAFITTWKTDNAGTSGDNQVTIPTIGAGYNYHVEWGDGSSDNNVTGDIIHTYAAPGTYTVSILGDFPAIYFNNGGDKAKILTVQQWGTNTWASLARSFRGCWRMTITATDAPDLSNITDLSSMFALASSLIDGLSHWDVSNVREFESMFSNAIAFNDDLSNWDMQNANDLQSMFSGARAFNGDLSTWNVSNVGNMFSMFFNAEEFNGDISNWDVGSVSDMRSMFQNATFFDGNLSSWNISQVTDMTNMLFGSGISTANYDKLLNGWVALPGLQAGLNFSASGVTFCLGEDARNTLINDFNWLMGGGLKDCSEYFVTTWKTDNSGTSADNQVTIPTIGTGYDYTVDWGDGNLDADVTGDITHSYASSGTYQVTVGGDFPRIYFNNSGDQEKMLTIEAWGTNQWASMNAAFSGCTNLVINATDHPDLSGLDDLSDMFSGATSLDSDFANWDVSTVADMTGMLDGTSVNAKNFDATLKAWALLPGLQSNVAFGANGLSYCLAQGAGDILTGTFNWDIAGASKDCSDFFVTTWKTDNPGISGNNQITIPTTGGGYNYTVDWGDGNIDTDVTGDITHNYASSGTYQVTIGGDFPRVYFNDSGDKEKILTIESWGIIEWSSMENAFFGCSNLVVNDINSPDLSNVQSLRLMFLGASSLTGNFSNWDISNVNNISGLFANATSFTSDLSNWDVGQVTNMINLFGNAAQFNSDLSNWNVSLVGDMANMFFGTTSFNSDLSNWDVSLVDNMSNMFSGATSFTSDLSGWDVGNVIQMSRMFSGASTFNSDLSNWDVSSCTNMQLMFHNALSFDGDLGNWDVSLVSNMANMLDGTVIPPQRFDNILLKWSQLPGLQSNVSLGATGLFYCLAETERTTLQNDFNWTIIDSGQDCPPFFVTTWKTDNPGASSDNQITIPTTGTGYNYTVDWGDGEFDIDLDGDITHTYASPGTYTVSITGEFPRIYFNNGGDKDKILTIDNWGNVTWSSMNAAFSGCSNLVLNTSNAPDLSAVSDVSEMFQNATSVVSNLSLWDVSTLTDMSFMLSGAAAFNDYLNNWDVSNVTNMEGMFSGATSFSINLADWNVSNVINMANMLNNTHLTFDQYDLTLDHWSKLPSLQSNVDLGAVDLTFCLSETSRNTLINDHGWTINDGGKSCPNFFITTWKTDNPGTSPSNEVFIPVGDTETGYIIDWGDGSFEVRSSGTPHHTYSTPGTYTISLGGAFNSIYLNDESNEEKLLTIEQWGDIRWESLESAFKGCTNLTMQATDAPDLSNSPNLEDAFSGAVLFDGDLSNWDVSSIATLNMDGMLDNTGIPQGTYTKILDSWASPPDLQSNVTLGAAGLSYCDNIVSRSTLIDDFGWTITGDNPVSCSNEKDILTFTMADQVENATIDDVNHTVEIIVTSGIDVTTLSPTFMISDGASASPSSNQVQDFSNPVTYQVIAEDGTTQDWLITVIVQQTQTITFDEIADRTYGDASVPLGAVASSGLDITYVVSEGSELVSFSNNELRILGAGEVTVTARQEGNALIALAENVSRTFNVGKVELTVQALDQMIVYGESIPTLDFSYTGFVNGDDETSVAIEPLIEIISDTGVDAGGYTIGLSGGSDDNYDFNLINGSLTVQKAQLIATANDENIIYGDEIPLLSFSYSGFVGTEDVSVLNVEPGISTTAVQFDNVGTYVIDLSGGSDDNYDFNLINGSLTVQKTQLIVTASDVNITYSEQIPSLSVSYSGFVNSEDLTVLSSEPVAATFAQPFDDAGNYVITASGGSDDNYEFIYVEGNLTIDKAVLTATADSKEISEGELLPLLTISYEGFLGDDTEAVIDQIPIASVSATSSSDPGTFDIILSGGNDNNYTLSLVNGILTINEVLGLDTSKQTNVFPNPASDYFMFSSSNFESVDIIGLDGKLKIRSSKSRVDISDLSNGVYLVLIKDEDGAIISKARVIKQ